jgi:transcriptional regulator with XRE-family HTH domain
VLLEISELPPPDRTWLEHTGACCSYISRVEDGHTVPAVETLEKIARALEVPMCQIFYDGEQPPKLPNLPKRKSANGEECGGTGRATRAVND